MTATPRTPARSDGAEREPAGDRIRVVHILTRLAVGGAQETALATCALADRSRFDQVLVVGAQTGSEGQLFSEVPELGVPLVVVPSLVRQLSPFRDVRATMELVRVIEEHRPEIVHTHSSKAGVIGRIAARWCRTPVVIHSVHGWSFHNGLPSVTRWAPITAERAMARITDRFVVETDEDRRTGVDLAIGRPDKYATIRNGVDLERFTMPCGDTEVRLADRRALGIPDNAPVVGTVIRLVPQKNPLGLVQAAALVVAALPDCHLVIVGDGPMRSQTEALVAELGLGDRVHLTGIRRDVDTLLQAFDVFALSSHWEGLPRVVLEAMANGLPIVAPDIDGLAEAVDDGVSGILVAPGDVPALAQGILDVLADRGRAAAYGRAARTIVEKRFDLRRMVVQLEDLYTSLAVPR